jgi:hypothetical protein
MTITIPCVLTFSSQKNLLPIFLSLHLLIIIPFYMYHCNMREIHLQTLQILIFIPFLLIITRAATLPSFRAVLLRILDFQLKNFFPLIIFPHIKLNFPERRLR